MTWYGWGLNSDGLAGLGDNSSHLSGPVAWAPGSPDLVQIASGSAHAVGIDGSGDVWTWGFDDGSYRLGQGNISPAVGLNIPTRVAQTGISNIVEVAAVRQGSFARRNDGAVFFVGKDQAGESGNSSPFLGFIYTTWTQVAAWPANIIQMVGGELNVIMRASDGKAWFAGDSSFGAAGDGAAGARTVPTQWSARTDLTWVTIGEYDVIALAGDGHAYGSGRNDFGQLVTGDNAQRLGATDLGATDATVVTLVGNDGLFGTSSLWLNGSGVLKGAGANQLGLALANGTTNNLAHTSLTTHTVGAGKLVASIMQGWSPDTALLLTTDGLLYGIMDNEDNQIDGTATANYASWQPVWPAVLTRPVADFVSFGFGEFTCIARIMANRSRAWAFITG